MKPYIYVTKQDGTAITIFTRYIALIEPSQRIPGTYIQMSLGGVEVRETYEEVMKQMKNTFGVTYDCR